MKTCPDCDGDGVLEKGTDDERRCPTCGGSGFVPDDNRDNEEEVIKTSRRFRFGALISKQLKDR
jgi:DnaJ-class molecular chaperone